MRFKDTIGISHLLKMVEHELSQKIDTKLQELGLTLPQYSTLSMIEADPKITNASLARKCSVTPQTMNRILQNLEKANFVKKTANPNHGLKMDFTLTAKALKVLCDAHSLVNDVELCFIKGLSKTESGKLQQVLKKALGNMKSEKDEV